MNFVEFRDGQNFVFFETIECRVTYDMITPWHGACVMSDRLYEDCVIRNHVGHMANHVSNTWQAMCQSACKVGIMYK